eukprot:359665_1
MTDTNPLAYIPILNNYLTNNTSTLTQKQLEQIYELSNKLTKFTENKLHYRFDPSITFINEIFGVSKATMLRNKISISILMLSIIVWLVTFLLCHNTSINLSYICSIIIITLLWIPYSILWIISSNIYALKLIIKSFEWWLRIILLPFVSVMVYKQSLHSDNVNINTTLLVWKRFVYVLYGLIFILLIINVSLFDAYNIKRLWKILMSTFCALLLIVISLSEINVASQSIHVFACIVLAIFIFKQAILTTITKNKCILIQHNPSVMWINHTQTKHTNSEIQPKTPTENAIKICSTETKENNRPDNVKIQTDIVISYHKVTANTDTIDQLVEEIMDTDMIQDDDLSKYHIENNVITDVPVEITEEMKIKELETKCITLTTINEIFEFTMRIQLNTVAIQHTFKNIQVDEFWDKFWSNNAVFFTPSDWLKQDSLNENIKHSFWKLYTNGREYKEMEWYDCSVECITKLEDMPSFMPSSATQSRNKFEYRFCKIKPYFYVIHKVLSMSDVPFSDYFKIHQKFELRQIAHVNNENEISYSTYISIYIGIEWIKSTWFKSQIEGRTLESIKRDCIAYCKYIDEKILNQSKFGQKKLKKNF